MFFYTSNPDAFGNSCAIVSNNYNPIPYNEIMLMSLSYNASAPKGTSYGNCKSHNQRPVWKSGTDTRNPQISVTETSDLECEWR